MMKLPLVEKSLRLEGSDDLCGGIEGSRSFRRAVGRGPELNLQSHAFVCQELGTHDTRGLLHAAAADRDAEFMHPWRNKQVFILRLVARGALEIGLPIHRDGKGQAGRKVIQFNLQTCVLFGIKRLWIEGHRGSLGDRKSVV